MKVKDFFILVIKLFGLYSLILSLFQFLPNSITYFVSFLSYGSEAFEMLFVYLIGFGVMIFLTYILIMKAPKIVSFLKLEEGFDSEELSFKKFNDKSIIQISCILLGGILFFDGFPDLLGDTINAISSQNGNYFIDENSGINSMSWLINLVRVFTALALMFYYKTIQEWISNLGKDKD